MKAFLFLIVCFVGTSAVSNSNQTLFDIAKKNGLHDILMDLGVRAGLADSMKEPGPWTVFAPTDLAFAELPHVYLENLKKNVTLLENFLKYHVVKGIYMAKDLDANDMELQTVGGGKIRVNVYRSTRSVTVEGCKIVNFDNVASNGVMHILDEVLIAPIGNLFMTLKKNPDFSIFFNFLAQVGLDKELESGPYTVFAPGDGAFRKLGNETLQRLHNDPDLLKVLLKYHIVHGVLWKAGMHSTYLETLVPHDKIFIRKSFFGILSVENALIVSRDIPATNGVIHEIHKVLDIEKLRSVIIG